MVTPNSRALSLQPHSPILVDGNQGFTFANGVVGGSGTVTDPYVIEGWDIDASSSTGIEIRDTTAHLVVRSVHVHSGGPFYGGNEGVKILAAMNVAIEYSTFTDNMFGISTVGRLGLYPANIGVSDNSFSHNGRALNLFGVNVTVSRNGISHNGMGIEFGLTNATISGNEISNNNGMGITGYGSHITVSDNDISYSDLMGIAIGGNNLNISANRIFSNGSGGIYVLGGYESEISGNTVSNNRRAGVELEIGREIVVRHNNIVDNGYEQGSNDIGDFDPSDAGVLNSWDGGYPGGGNFWSDYSGVDNCSGPGQDICPDPDGLGDTPYLVGEFSRDQYPLVRPFETIRGQLEVQPHVISLSSKARYVNAFIELPDGYDGSNIDAGSIRLNETIAPDPLAPIIVTDHNGDTVPDLMVKFRLQDVRLLFPRPGVYTLAVRGNTIVGGRPFTSFDRVLVTSPTFARSVRLFP